MLGKCFDILQKIETKISLSKVDPDLGVHHYVNVNGVKLHYVESGDSNKPLMLFLHGFPQFWWTKYLEIIENVLQQLIQLSSISWVILSCKRFAWRHQIRHFQKTHRVVAVDMRFSWRFQVFIVSSFSPQRIQWVREARGDRCLPHGNSRCWHQVSCQGAWSWEIYFGKIHFPTSKILGGMGTHCNIFQNMTFKDGILW